MTVLLLTLLALTGCSGGPCTSDVQCGGTSACVSGGGGYGCGEYFTDYGCGDSGGCDSSSACQGYVEACGEGSRCVPRCEDDSTCASTETCDLDAHFCVARACTDPANPCATFTHCDTATGTCAADTCSTRADCATGGYCVNGTCAAQPGQCAQAYP